jgi:hypothetical protein
VVKDIVEEGDGVFARAGKHAAHLEFVLWVVGFVEASAQGGAAGAGDDGDEDEDSEDRAKAAKIAERQKRWAQSRERASNRPSARNESESESESESDSDDSDSSDGGRKNADAAPFDLGPEGRREVARNDECEWVVGRPTAVRAWQLAVPTMRVGERCRLRAKPAYAYGARGDAQLHVPPHAIVEFELRLVRVSEATLSHEERERQLEALNDMRRLAEVRAEREYAAQRREMLAKKKEAEIASKADRLRALQEKLAVKKGGVPGGKKGAKPGAHVGKRSAEKDKTVAATNDAAASSTARGAKQ